MRVISKTDKPLKYDADVIVIGSGPAGSIAAQTIAKANRKVIIIEEDKMGGKCPNYSCVPTRALMQTVITSQSLETAGKVGIVSKGYKLDFEHVKTWAKKAVSKTGVENEKINYNDKNIGYVKGHAHFITPYTLTVGLKRLSAKNYIIATGQSQEPPNITGLENSNLITYKNFLNTKKLPKSVAIIGGSSMGYEYAQIFRAFGVKTHLFETKGHLFPHLDLEVGDLAEGHLSKLGVRVHTQSKVTKVSKSASALVLEHQNHGQKHQISVDAVFIASGHSPNMDIGLENAQIKYTNDGIHTNAKMQTSQKHIFAVGDVTESSHNANSAFKQGQTAAHNILHRKKHNFSNHATPHVAWGMPEIATVGMTERQMKLTGRPYQSAIAPINVVGRSFSSDFEDGFVKIVTSHTGIVMGASVVAPHAGEIIGELTFAVQNHRRACDISNTIHPFSSWSEAVRVAASKVYCI